MENDILNPENMDETPPSKKIKFGQEFIELIEDCYDTLFNNDQRTEEDQARLDENIAKICETLEQVQSSYDVAFGPNRVKAKITWAKCLYLLLESGEQKSLRSLNILTGQLRPGVGML
jgi:hypothetical protein